MVALDLNLHAVEDSVGMGLGSDAHVLLAEALHLDIDRDRFL